MAEKQRSRRRRNVIGASPHRDDYVRLMQQGWSSLALERYAMFRYGEDVPASTFRTYRERKAIPHPEKPLQIDPEATLDVLQERAQVIALQKERIAIDVKHEKEMNKLFGSTRGEIEALDRLLNSHKADLQDLGLMPKAGDVLDVRTHEPSGAEAPRHQTLGAALGVEDEGDVIGMARWLHERSKGSAERHPANGQGNGNAPPTATDGSGS